MRVSSLRRIAIAAVWHFASGALWSQEQNLPRIADPIATAHLRVHIDPVYPAIAKAAHISGFVTLDVIIDSAGNVIAEKAVDGPAMLIGAAEQAVKQWKYQPFETGQGGPVRTYIILPVGFRPTKEQAISAEDNAIGREYFALDSACRDSLRTPNDQTRVTCQQEVNAALRFPDQNLRHLEVLDAHENLGRALLHDGQAAAAKLEFSEAIAIARSSLKESDAEFAYPLFWRASAEISLQETNLALADYSEGEACMRLAIKNLPSMTKQYGFTLQKMLSQHAAYLESVERRPEADRLLLEVSALKSASAS